MTGIRTARSVQLSRLRHIEDQVHSIARMVEQDQYCIDVLTQVSAACRALQSVALALMDEHVNTCLVEAAHDPGSDRQVRVKEASDAIARLVRS